MTIRLNKVTRDLNVGITTVVDFLQKKGYVIEANPNTKITDEQYAALVKEFSKDKNLKMESEKIFQERQNKERNKASVSIEDITRDKKDSVIETVIPEDVRPKFKPIGKIDLDQINRKRVKTATEPVHVEEEVVSVEDKTEDTVSENKENLKKEENQNINSLDESDKMAISQPHTESEDSEEQHKEKTSENLKQDLMEEKEGASESVAISSEQTDDVFKIRSAGFKSNINVVGQIDLAALNQSTRPKKKSKEERRKEREEKDKLRQEQRKQMKDAIIKEIRKTDDRIDKNSLEEAGGRKKRNRINKERVDIASASNNSVSNIRSEKPKNNVSQTGGKHKDRYKKVVNKPEISDEDVAKQVKETLARLTNKGKNKAAKYRKEKRETIQNRQLEQEELEQEESKVLKLTEFVTANELANMMDVSVTQVISTCMSVGLMVSINQRLDAETINLVAEEFGFRTEYVSADVAQAVEEEADAEEDFSRHFLDVLGGYDLEYGEIFLGGSYSWVKTHLGFYTSFLIGFQGGWSASVAPLFRLTKDGCALDLQVYAGPAMMDMEFAGDMGLRFDWRGGTALSLWDFVFGCQVSGSRIVPTFSVGIGIPLVIGTCGAAFAFL